VIGVVGIASVMQPLNDATATLGLLQIAWFGWLGGGLLATRPTASPDDPFDPLLMTTSYG
jgi:hypothetical protein